MAGTAPGTTAPHPPESTAHILEVSHVHGDAFAIDIRDHRLLVDQPLEAGGTDTAPTPTELFAASLAGCVAFYAGRYLLRHGLNGEGLRVRAEFTMATDRPPRVDTVRLVVAPPRGLSEQRCAALHAVVSHCTVHNTLLRPPEIVVEVAQ
ncbi:OsmC family protein [Streptomyces sp. NPDC050549]|uniref:OsmC family protein n=1 Tax=Streptomyces sp. NPDC050549 TaxID=3155406 RepID=UPI003432F487